MSSGVNVWKIVGVGFAPGSLASYFDPYLEDVSASYKSFISTCP
jgi:hypothetical protein